MASLSSSLHFRRLVQVATDAVIVGVAYYLAFVLRFDAGVPERYAELLAATLPFVVLGKVAVFALFGLYHKLWRFVDARDFESMVRAVIVASLLLVVAVFLLSPERVDPPRGVVALDFLLTLAGVAGARLLVRGIGERRPRWNLAPRDAREVLIVGAGGGGQSVAFELRRNPELRTQAIGFVDDDPRKQGVRVAG
ncbi:MAG TPA: hypothetical protein VK387_07800, partial [Thermoleophilaceae bacterium]|nr:hypothetical protein [Thermoleophilaceae bacterium]